MAGRTRPRRARFRKQTALRFFRSAVFVPVDLLCRPFVSVYCVGRPFFRFGRSDETFLFGKRIIFIENFAGTNFHSIFAVPKRRFRRRHAEIAQLVERNLAKVEVAGPSPVFRSNNKGRTSPVLPFVVDAGHARGLSARPQGALFRGRGCRQRIAAVTRAKRECESRFPLQRGKSGKRKENRKILLFVFRGGERDSTPATSRRPFQGPGVSTTNRGRHSRYVRVPFSAPEKREESCDSSLFVLSVWYRGLCRFRVSDADSGKV